MNPLILYRVNNSKIVLNKLPVIDLNKFYTKSGAQEEQISFTVKKLCFERKDYSKAISSVLTAQNFKEVMSFANDEDRQLIRQMDKFIRSTENKIVDLSKLKVSDLDFSKFELKNERLRRLPRKVLEMRAELFLKFTKQFLAASSTLSL